MTYVEHRDRLADSASAEAGQVAARLLAGELTEDQAVVVLVQRLGVARAQARVLAEQAVRATLMAEAGTVLPALGLPVEDEAGMLTRAAVTVVGKTVERATPMHVERLADGTVLEAAERAFSAALHGYSTEVEMAVGWTRRLSSGACELCHWLDKDGRVFPPSKAMHHHKGCRCEQEIVYRTERV